MAHRMVCTGFDLDWNFSRASGPLGVGSQVSKNLPAKSRLTQPAPGQQKSVGAWCWEPARFQAIHMASAWFRRNDIASSRLVIDPVEIYTSRQLQPLGTRDQKGIHDDQDTRLEKYAGLVRPAPQGAHR